MNISKIMGGNHFNANETSSERKIIDKKMAQENGLDKATIKSNTADAEIDIQKVKDIQQEISDGTYVIDHEKVAGKIIEKENL